MASDSEMDDGVAGICADSLPVATDRDRFATMHRVTGVSPLGIVQAPKRSVVERRDVISPERVSAAFMVLCIRITPCRQEESQRLRHARQEGKRANERRTDQVRNWLHTCLLHR
ncbi:Uncharacterized protein ToN1_07780 [Aromatoleum petrolei]|nr:Uncharacterized protein ToN1_07780 [Aromatoleum petrolei]